MEGLSLFPDPVCSRFVDSLVVIPNVPFVRVDSISVKYLIKVRLKKEKRTERRYTGRYRRGGTRTSAYFDAKVSTRNTYSEDPTVPSR